ncbi:beta-hexosaminidase subunit beta isoform X1 [Lepeophtheirus salmonis]|uniref:beta-hexosaminidase subunit beta isoform X1 n=2 Tax=Lepeophtheirus salmonis TaxID=72036 RepID=UPI001AEACFBD|nr:beta-hexosaminidase subunit beta-like isoform X1 [Lepeophtheirus salmonis]
MYLFHIFLLLLLKSPQSRVLSIEDEFKPKGYQNIRQGPWVHQTMGEVWPKPQFQDLSNEAFLVEDVTFVVSHDSPSSKIINQAIKRYEKRIKKMLSNSSRNKATIRNRNFPLFNRTIPLFLIKSPHHKKENYILTPNMNEEYEVQISSYGSGAIISQSVWGLLRGMESLAQMMYLNKYQIFINRTYIRDFPRFPYRALMLDTARHFLSKKVILENLDLMEMNKLNVFHWHMTDTESFPFRSDKFPNMSRYGAYDSETHVYSVSDVREIIQEAELRGIRIIPEFDIPGHTRSWGEGNPDLLTTCYDSSGEPTNIKGPINPVLASTYNFLHDIFEEILNLFKDDYVMLGGDEVPIKCWSSNPNINEVLVSWNAQGQYRQLEYFFVARMMDIMQKIKSSTEIMVWEEVFTSGYLDRVHTIVNAWKDWGPGWKRLLSDATSKGYRAVLTAPWYLNYADYGSDWVKRYEIEPLDFLGDESQYHYVLGGGACAWGEYLTSRDLIPRIWPRASAVAERLWSDKNVRDIKSAAKRLQEHECRMLGRGFPVGSANGAGYCPGIEEL